MIEHFINGLSILFNADFNYLLEIETEGALVLVLLVFSALSLLIRYVFNIALMHKAFPSLEFISQSIKINWILLFCLCIVSALIGGFNYYDGRNFYAGMYLSSLFFNIIFYIDGYKFIMRIVNILIVIIGSLCGLSLASIITIDDFSPNLFLFYLLPIFFVIVLEKLLYNIVSDIKKAKDIKDAKRVKEFKKLQKFLVVFEEMYFYDKTNTITYVDDSKELTLELGVFLKKFSDKESIHSKLSETQENKRKVLSENFETIEKYYKYYEQEIYSIKYVDSIIQNLNHNYHFAFIEASEKMFGKSKISELSLIQKDKLFKIKESIIEREEQVINILKDIKSNFYNGYSYFVNKYGGEKKFKRNSIDNTRILLNNIELIKKVNQDLNLLDQYSSQYYRPEYNLVFSEFKLQDLYKDDELFPVWDTTRYIVKNPKDIEDLFEKYNKKCWRIIEGYNLFYYKFNTPSINYKRIKRNNETLNKFLSSEDVFNRIIWYELHRIVDSIIDEIERGRQSCTFVFKDDLKIFNKLFVDLEKRIRSKADTCIKLKGFSRFSSLSPNSSDFSDVNRDIVRFIENTSKHKKSDLYVIISLIDDAAYRRYISDYCFQNSSLNFIYIDIFRELRKREIETLSSLATSMKLQEIEDKILKEKEAIEKKKAIEKEKQEKEKQDFERIQREKEIERQRLDRIREEAEKIELEEKRILLENLSKAKAIATNYTNAFNKYFPNVSINLITNDHAVEIIKSETKLREYQNFVKRINNAVSNWSDFKGMPYYHFYFYYPKRFDDITSQSIKARNLIYNFKNGSHFTEVLNIMQEKLKSTFNSEDLSKMTLVCIPASNILDNNKRYAFYTDRLCSSIGLRNAFNHISITKEKSKSHLGGTDVAEYSFDINFFKEAFVILFDDVVTRGRSMSQFKAKMKELGADVVCAISIGRTVSDYNGTIGQQHPWTETY